MKTITSSNIKALWCEKIKNNNQNKFKRVNLRGNLGIWMRPSNLMQKIKLIKIIRVLNTLSLSLTHRQNGLSFINKRGERFYRKKKEKKRRGRERERERRAFKT
jgi:hypothetical protein